MAEKRWVVRVYWEPSRQLDATAVSLVLCRLQSNSAVIGQHPVDGVWEATVSIEAPTRETASSHAWDLVVGAGGHPLGVELLREPSTTQTRPPRRECRAPSVETEGAQSVREVRIPQSPHAN